MKTMRNTVCALALASAATASNADLAYASDNAGGFWLLDMQNLTSQLLFSTSERFQTIAASANGRVFGSTGAQLFEIDTNTGGTTLIGTIQGDDTLTRTTHGMAFIGGQLVGVEWNNFQNNGGSRVYAIDLQDASVSDIVTSDSYAGIARGATASEDGSSILIRDNFLASIDIATAETTRIGQTSNSNFAVELINGTFYAATNNGIVNTIDAQGRLDELHDFGSQAFRGLTVVPAPGTGAGIALLGMGLARRRRVR